MRLISLLFWAFVILPAFVKAQVVDVTYPEDLCINERFEADNQSTGYSEYRWDFCPGDLEETPTAGFLTNSSLLNGAFSVELLYDNGWLGFFPSRNGDVLYKADFESDLKSTPSFSEVAVEDGFIDGPVSISFLDSADHYFCFLMNRDDGKVIRLDFGEDLSSDPTANDLGNFSQIPAAVADGLKVVADSIGSYVILVTYGSSIGIINLGNSPSGSGTFSSFSIGSSSRLFGIDVINHEGNWYGLATSFGNGKVYHIDFGERITNSVTVTELSNGGHTLGSPADIRYIKDGTDFYALMQTRAGSLFLYDFTQNPSSTSPDITNLGTFSLFDNNSSGLDVVKDSSEWIAINTNFSSNEVHYISFKNTCDVSDEFINGPSPNVFYSSAGDFPFEISFVGDSSVQYLIDTITISSNVAPEIEFTYVDSRCVTSSNTFTPSVTGLTSYSWDFDGDGLEDSDAESPQVLFDTLGGAGTYTVRLDVSDGTCDNFFEQEITIYEEPPVPSFTVTSSGSLCTNNELTLTNTTDETGYDDVLTYQWVIDGEIASQKDTVYTFTESGEKTITLQSFLPGCSSAVTEQSITIGDGPLVSFTYSNNCFEEEIVFTSEVEGAGITGYNWDFGDGTGSSTDANPTYTYLVTGDYTVSLTVTNDAGCETEYSELLTVSDAPAADFAVDGTTENLPTRFSGEDLTHGGDSVETWLWNLEGAEYADDTIEHTFTEPGDYLVSLDVTTYQGCSFTVAKTVTINAASEPTSLFSSVDEACIDEQVTFVNESVNAASYEWDFCPEDILAAPQTSELESLELTNQPFEIEVVEDNGSWFGFITNRNSNTLLRLDFGADLLSDPAEVDLGDFGELLDGPSGIGLLQIGAFWYGVTGNLDDGLIHLLTFGDGIDQPPTITEITTTGLTSSDGVELVNDDGSYKAIILSGANLHILDFGSDITSAPTQSTVSISGATRLWDISLIREDGNWYAILDAFTSGKLFHLDFGTAITSTFTATQIDMSGITFNSPTDLNLVRSGSDVYGLVNLRSGNLVRLNFGPDVEDLTPSIEVLTGLNLGNDLAGQSLISKDGSLIVFTTDFIANSVNRLVFEDSCLVSELFSTQETPDPISYTEAGSYEISLTATHENGSKDISTKLIVVNDQTAPDAGFTTETSNCVTSSNTFTPSVTGLTSYSWDFDGDGLEDSDAESPQVLFDTLGGAGTYTVRLDVSDGTCDNFFEQEITIYEEPPVPSFTVTSSGSLCTNNELTLTNTTDETGYDDVLTYQWVIDGEIASQKDTVYTFTESGEKTITLQSFLPGCSSAVTEQSITIGDGPLVSFTYSNNCFEEEIVFTSEVEGAGITGYNWDFGDGTGSSTDANPTYTYLVTGDYTVSLTVTNDAGCETEYSELLTVSDAPAADFAVDGTTENLPTRFSGEDLTHGGDSVETWLWNLEGAEYADDTIEHTFTEPGDYLVSLDVTTYQGCSFTVAKTVTINAASEPTSLFSSVDEACIDEQVTFVNESVNAASYEWDFCPEDILAAPQTSELESLELTNQPFEIEVVEDNGSWFGFITNRNSNTLLRLDFGADLLSDPAEVDLGDFGELLDGPSGIGLLQIGAFWYGVTGNLDDGLIHLLTFGDGIDQPPTITEITTTGLTSSDGVELVNDDGSYKAIILSGANLHILDFGSDITSAPTQSTVSISGATRLWDISLIREDGNWYAILDAFTSGKLFHLDFGTAITSTFTATQIDMSGITFNSPTDLNLVRSGSDVYGLVNLRSGNLVRLNFGPDVEDLTPSIEVLTGLNLGNDLAGQSLISKDGSLIVFTTDFIANSVNRLVFEDSCLVSELFSTQETPDPISYTEAGSYEISLTATHENGSKDISTKLIVVNDQTAPDAGFTTETSNCVTSSNTFTPSVTGLTSYSWDFDGDGLEDSDAESPQVLFDTLGGAGTYTVRLDVSDGTCDNFFEQEITIYEEPPVPSFTVTSSGSLCTNNELTLTNTTDETGYDDVLTYQWVIDGEIASQKDTVYTFTESGEKTITLQSFLPGCSSAVTEQSITIGDGPLVSFTYSNNCFEEEIVFTSEVEGAGITGYNWDFGDGTGSSTDANPTYTYLVTGDYTVSLTVTNDAGCETEYSELLTVSDAPAADFAVDGTTENLPTRFSGEDLTHGGDSVETWLWNLEGAEYADDTIEHTFTEPGDYLVSLDVTTYQGCSFTVAKTVTINAASEPTSLFSSVDEACIDEQVTFVNESVNAASYEWDFCPEDILAAPQTSELESLELTNQPFEIEVVEDNGSWFGFITNRNSNTLLRLDFGADLLSDPAEVDLGDFGELLDGPSGIGLLQIGAFWYGVTGNLDDGLIHLLTFGDGIDQPPTITEITTTGLTSSDGVELVNDDGSYKAIILSGANLHILDFGSDITSAPTQSTVSISGATRLWDISLIREDGNWYAILDAFTSGKLFHLDFGTAITSTFTATQIDMSGITFNSPTDLNLVRSGSDVYGLVNLRSGNLVRLNFGPDVEDLTPSIEVLTGLNLGNDLAGQSLISKDGSLIVFTTDFIANSVNRLVFEDSCLVSELFSTQETPDPISYTEAGSYEISLTATHENGSKDISTKLIVVNDQTAPDAGFTTETSNCVTSSNTFTPSVTGLTLYSWDFNNDGIEDSNAESPQVLFDTLGGAGTYTIRLDVSDGTCDNFFEQEITIYEEPPVPGFNVSASRYCIGADIDFSNITDDASYTGPLTYAWEFIDDATSIVVGTSNQENPSFSFMSSGTKTVILTSSIPGCEETTQQTITINPSPVADFTATSVCQEESMQFTNTSEDAVSYLWDFGDGFTSTSENPSHIYTVAGNYNVTLTSMNSDGCEDAQTVEVAVSEVPSVSFDFEIPCNSDDGVPFTDLSTVTNADVVSWIWFVDGEEVSTLQSPVLSFSEVGVKNVSLAVTSSNGCESTYNEDIEILATPSPDFTVIIGCEGEATSFEDVTPETINSWLWTVNGVNYNTQDASHIFTDAGTYEVSLEVTGQNFCSESITKSIEIIELPTIDFTLNGDCDNELISAMDISTSEADPIVSRIWTLDGAVVGNGSQLFLELSDNTYELQLEVETEGGCMLNSTQTIQINDSPVAEFTSSRTYGKPGDQLNFSNSSSGAVSYQWLLNGSVISTSDQSQNINFSEPGTHTVSLVAQNSLGCNDTTDQEILIAIPEVDLSIGSFELVNENNTRKVFLEIQNNSNLPIELTEAQITLEGQFSITEQILEFIDVGESSLVSLNLGIPIGPNSETSYLCVKLTSQYAGYEDINPIDNEKCLTLQPEIKVENPFPNPVKDRFRMKVIAPTDGQANLILINSAGKIQMDRVYNAKAGLNNFFVDMRALDPGIYYITIDVLGTLHKRKVIKL